MQYTQQAAAVTAEVNKAVQGKQQTVNTIWMAMLAGGHVLIEDIPGVGKTTLALAFARALDLKESRVYAGCSAVRFGGIFRLPERDRQVCVPRRCGDVQPVFGR